MFRQNLWVLGGYGAGLLMATLIGVAVFASGIIGSGGLNTDTYLAGFKEGQADCTAGQDQNRELLHVDIMDSGTQYIAATTDRGYGYDVGYSTCQGYAGGHKDGYSAGQSDGYNNGASDGYSAGYTAGFNDACEKLANQYNASIDAFFAGGLYCR